MIGITANFVMSPECTLNSYLIYTCLILIQLPVWR